MHEAVGAHHFTTENVADALVAKTDAEHGDSRSVGQDHLPGDAGFFWGTRARGDHDPAWRECGDVGHGDLVVPEDPRLGSEFPEILHEVVGEGVVVIDDEEHGSASGFCDGGICTSDSGESPHRLVDAFLMFAVGR